MPKGVPGSTPPCSVDGCDKLSDARRLCSTHYSRWQRHRDPTYLERPNPGQPCKIDGCDDKEHGHGWCKFHWQRWKRDGTPEHPRHTPLGRFAERVQTGPRWRCWTWTSTLVKGYGIFYFDGEKYLAHRWFYEQTVGPIPDGLSLDHVCHNLSDCDGGGDCPHRACVNPYHLEPLPLGENVLRGNSVTGRNSRKTHCKHGHPFSAENTYVDPAGVRRCRECSRIRQRKAG